MNARTIARGVATLTLTAGLGLAGSVAVDADTPVPSPSASASPTPTPHLSLAALKVRCNSAVQRRLGTLGADDTFVKQSSALTSADRTALEGQISADQSGLTALDGTIQADTTFAQAHAECELIVTDYRVYVMEDPKIHEVIAADAVSNANGTFETLIPELQSLINASSVSATVKAQAQADLNDLTSKVDASHTSISGVTASVINLTPAGWPGNQVDLKSARSNIKTARADLTGARADVSHILQLLG
ncbi:MAG TPA: hypothetical protein VI434_12035 [Candidatus Dormibacteraeota bacterium]